MEEFSSLIEGQTNMEPTILGTQEGVSKDWTQESVIPQHQMTPPIGSSSQGSVNNNLTNFSTQPCDVLSVLEATLDERHIEDSLVRSKLLSHQLGPQAMNEREPNNRRENDQRQNGGHRNLSTKTIGSKSSLYRGVIKCNEQRFEAFVWDNTDPGDKGRIVYIGGYWTEIDAARAHDLLSIKIGGLTALTNFPVRCYSTEMDEMQSMNKLDYIHAVRRRGKGNTDTDSPYRGVYRVSAESRKWEARLGREGLPTINLGTYYTSEDAARAYDIVSIKLKGWDAITNFDWNSYEVSGIMESVITQAADGSVILQKQGTNNSETEAVLPQINNSLGQQHNPQQLTGNSSFAHGCQNPNLISSNHYGLGGFSGGAGSSGNSIANHGGEFPNQTATLQQSLQTQNQVNVNNDFNQNIFLNNNNNNNNNQFVPQSSNLPLLAHTTRNLELGKCLRFPDWPSDFGTRLLGGNLDLGPLRNITALNVQSQRHVESLSNITALNVQSQRHVESLSNITALNVQSQRHVGPLSNVTGVNVQSQTHLESLSNIPAVLNVESQTHGMVNQSVGATNGGCSFGSEIRPVAPSNLEFGSTATQLQLPELNQSYEPYNYTANTLNQIPLQNLNSSFSDGFQNPISEPNNSTGPPIQTTASQIDVDVSHYLNRSYLEDNDFACDFDMFEAINGGRQGI